MEPNSLQQHHLTETGSILMKHRKTAVRALIAGGLMMGAASAANAETFKWAFQGDLQTLDPHGLFETMTLGFQRNIYEGLVIRNDKMEMEGALAEKWENVNPTTWRFHLRKGVKFHAGGDMKADDVKFSVERLSTEGSDMKVVAALIKEAKIIDDYTVDIITPAPNPILPLQLEIFYIMDKQWAEEHKAVAATNVKGGDEGNYANLNANGTGPFMVTSRQSGVKTVLKRNPNYWGKLKTNITEAIFTPIDQDATRVAALISGNVDMAYPIPVQDWKRLEDADGVKPLTGPEARTIFLGFDQARDELTTSNIKGKNPFKDVRVRKAFMQAINIDAIKEKIMRGAATPTGQMVAPQINGFNEALNKRLPYDVDAAKKLMAEAGYADGFEVTMDCPNNRYVNDEKICQASASMLAKINVKVNLLAQPKSKYFGKVLAQNNYDTSFFLLGWTPSTFDSHNVISALMACRGGEDKIGAFNLGGYCNKRINELTAMIQEETDQAKRQAMIDEAFKIHQDEVGHIPLHQQPLSWGVSDKVEVVQRPDNAFDLRYAVVKK
ncbi:MAG: ABC transporter substrate-binding protein [Rhizobiales bacterium]|nr:ABC transporter substrate-binding protein [Hyphomicrobiales bacterium]